MDMSVTLCRTQEAFHRDRAAKAELENVRVIAEEAAAAWALEAEAAEQREARRIRIKQASADGTPITELRRSSGGRVSKKSG